MFVVGPASAAGPWAVSTLDTTVRFALSKGLPTVTAVTSTASSSTFVAPTPESALPDAIYLPDSTRQPVKWSYDGASAGDNKVTFKYSCKSPDLHAESTWSAARLPGPVEHKLAITNGSDQTITFCPTPTISLTVLTPRGHDLRNWWVNKGAGFPLPDGTHNGPVNAGYARTLLSGPYSSDEPNRDAIPWFALQDDTAGRGLYGGIEFSGWTQIAIRAAGGDTSIAMGSRLNDGKTRLTVGPNASCELPPVFVGVYTGDVDDGCNRLHRWVEKHLRPPMPRGVTPVLVNNSWGSGMAVDDALARRMIDDCADLGMELYHVDAGWFKAVGDWHADPAKFPKGLESIADYAHSKALRFGLWIAWTQGGSLKDYRADTLSVFNPAQKDWFGSDYDENWRNAEFAGATVCLACRPARDWALSQLRRVVKDYKLDLLEHDQDMITGACSRTDHGHTPGDPVDVSMKAAEGYYSIYEQLLKDNPNLLLEDCLNGGRLVDFGVAGRVHYICATDYYDPMSLRRAFYDASYPLPPSMIEGYVADHPGKTIANFKYMLRSGTIGWCTIMLDTTRWTPEQKAAAKREFALYKQKLRPLIANGDIYHVLPHPADDGWDGVQYFDPNTGNGVLFAFRARSEQDKFPVKLRGLDPKRSYRLAPEDASVPAAVYSGKALMDKGLTLHLPETESSDLVFIEQVR